MGRMDQTPTIPRSFNPLLDTLPPCGGSTELEVECSRQHAYGCGGPACDGHYIACEGCVDCETPDVDRDPFQHLHEMRCVLSELAPAVQQSLAADPVFTDHPRSLDAILSYTEQIMDDIATKVELIERLLGTPTEPVGPF